LTIKEFVLEWEKIEGTEEEDKEEDKDENEGKEEDKDGEDKEDGEEDKDEEDTTVIEKIESTVKDGTIYNLQGIKVDKPEKGNLYIKNGKKFRVK
jgi:Skp family chaperone for outer membrane proteins